MRPEQTRWLTREIAYAASLDGLVVTNTSLAESLARLETRAIDDLDLAARVTLDLGPLHVRLQVPRALGGCAPSPARAVAASLDGRRVAVASEHELCVRGLPSGQVLRRLVAPPAGPLAFDAAGRLWSRQDLGELVAHDVDTGELVARVALPGVGVGEPFCLSERGAWAAAAIGSEVVQWELPTGRPGPRLELDEPAAGLWLSPDHHRLAIASADGLVLVFDARTGQMLSLLRGHEGGVADACFPAPPRSLITGGADGAVRTWDVAIRRETQVLEAGAPVHAIALSPDRRWLLVCAGDDVLALRTDDGTCLHRLDGVGRLHHAVLLDGGALVAGAPPWLPWAP